MSHPESMLIYRALLLAGLSSESPGGGGAPEGDARLLVRANAGEVRAFEELVRRHHAALRRFLRRFGLDDALAEDACQEAWMMVLRDGAQFSERSSFKTWLFQIGANRARDSLRKRGRDEARTAAWLRDALSDEEVVPAERFLPAGHEYAEHWADPPRVSTTKDGPEEAFAQREAARVVETTLATLPDSQAAVVMMRDFAGMTGEEVEQSLGLSGGHQRVLLHRGRMKLWRALEAYERGET